MWNPASHTFANSTAERRLLWLRQICLELLVNIQRLRFLQFERVRHAKVEWIDRRIVARIVPAERQIDKILAIKKVAFDRGSDNRVTGGHMAERNNGFLETLLSPIR
jgi:hypothetical protein